MSAVGMRMQRRRLPLGLLLRQTSLSFTGEVGDCTLQRVRKEAISWKTHFPGVASVVKVIWFRFRISAARELLSSTRPAFVRTHHACTPSSSLTDYPPSPTPSLIAHLI